MKMTANINGARQCAFCRYWSDFAGRYIKPKTGDGKIWEYETSARCMCTNGGGQRPANSTCSKFESKLRR